MLSLSKQHALSYFTVDFRSPFYETAPGSRLQYKRFCLILNYYTKKILNVKFSRKSIYNRHVNNTFLRRALLLTSWPFTDFAITLFANFTLVTFGTIQAVLLTICIGTSLNMLFLYFLSLEKELEVWVKKHTKKVAFARYDRLSAIVGKTTTVILAYIISGPAMVGAPLIWLFGIRGEKAYMLAFVGITLNAIIWVGGIYNLFWALIRSIF